jgi:hypothetical protein
LVNARTLDGEDCALFDLFDGAEQGRNRVESFLQRVHNPHQSRGVEADSIFQLALDLVGRRQHAALLIAEGVPGGAGLGKSLLGMLVTIILELTPQPPEFLRELQQRGFRHPQLL